MGRTKVAVGREIDREEGGREWERVLCDGRGWVESVGRGWDGSGWVSSRPGENGKLLIRELSQSSKREQSVSLDHTG